MKQLFVGFLGSVIPSGMLCLAAKVPVLAQASFRISFPSADNIKWVDGDPLHKVEFTLKRQRYLAYYDQLGNLIATSRFLSNLPPKLLSSIEKEFPEYKLTESLEVDNEEGTEVYATLVKDRTKMVLRSFDQQKWSVFQVSRK